ncbi:cell division protein FtsB [Polynucleobacter sphagniphilus]|uniref:Cell division protein FtsB n=1 Tax=Polynucleobacter sphagniphilus TaxID=1743169 RepID=A0AA43M7I3_9BURK|nr:cell division protein FtsB [Polynucleobacter sphagniphilus]MDH6503616.1 cell division protein FtsB [Polynucleobacter sphagniphilus]MDH6512831.1 cell division protein FtsB [Polynucleobacter sphagniphilus]
MRLVIYSMLLLLIAIQYPLWLGKGGWLKVYEMERQLQLQEAKNSLLALRNAKLAGDVKDLKEGTRAIEERARVEHGMIKEGEYFVQILPTEKAPSSANSLDGLKPPTSKQ